MKKHIVCFGDSNTHGYCADPKDCADGGIRYNESERWTCLLGERLGPDTLVLEEGLSGRTTVFSDPLHECMSGLDAIYSVLMSHEPVDLLIIMLGTNDTKERFSANAACIGIGMERLIMKAKKFPAGGTSPGSWSSPRRISAKDFTRSPRESLWAPDVRKNPGSWRNTLPLLRNASAARSLTQKASQNSIPWTACT